MNKEISSSVTFLIKYIIPILYISSIIAFSIIFIINSYYTFFNISLLLAGLLLILLFSYFYYFKLKKISIDNEYLYVSNYKKEIKINRNLIKEIKILRFHSPNIITICLYENTDFGNKIKFIPKIFNTLNIIDDLERDL